MVTDLGGPVSDLDLTQDVIAYSPLFWVLRAQHMLSLLFPGFLLRYQKWRTIKPQLLLFKLCC